MIKLDKKNFRQIIKDNKTLMYTYTKTNRVKNIIAKVDKSNNIVVKCPEFISVEMLDDFIFINFDKFEGYISKKKQMSLINLEENKITILGHPYQIILNKIYHGNEKYEIIGNKIYLFIKDDDHKQKLINKLLFNLGNDYLIKKAKKLAIKFNEIFNVKPSLIKTKWYESKWGQCNCSTKEITLAIQLYMMHEHIIDYVIIHELCHLIHPNHSTEFWQLVKQFCPNYKYIQEKLKFEC